MSKMRQALLLLHFMLVVVVFSPLDSLASSWDFNYKNLMQVRKGRNDTKQVPMYQYFSMGAADMPKNFSVQTDFMGYVDWASQEETFDLYQAVFHIEPAEHFAIDGGRQWMPDGFDAILMDGARFGWSPSDGYIGADIYAGIPRYLEEGDFQGVTEGLMVGANISLQNVKDTTGRLSVKWRKLDATKSDYRTNDTVYLGLASSHQFTNVRTTPNIYGDVEVDTAGKVVNVGTLGVDIYPHWRAAITLEGNYFNVDRNSAETTILGNYFSGGIYQGREALQIKLIKNLHFIQDFSYQHYNVPGRNGENGYLVGAGLDHWLETAKLSTLLEYYFRNDFGGRVNGGYLSMANRYFDKLTADVSLDVSRYSKITNKKDTAISLVGSLGYRAAKRCLLSLGGEFNHNNWFDREGRITVNFEFGLDGRDYTPEKRSKRVNRKFHEI